MTTTLKGEIPGARRARNKWGVRSDTRRFTESSDDKLDDAYVAGSTIGLPIIGSPHPSDSDAICHTLEVANTDPYAGWTVTAEYSSERNFDPVDPLDDEVLIRWTSEIYQEPVFLDIITGQAILNSAGDPFIDPIPARDAMHLIAIIDANVASVPSWAIDLQNAVNNATITIGGLQIAAGLAKVQRIDIQQRAKRGLNVFFPVTIEVHIRRDGWKFEPVDAGFRERNERNVLINIVNADDDQEVTAPALLNGVGQQLTDPSPSTAVFLEFNLYQLANLSLLPGIS